MHVDDEVERCPEAIHFIAELGEIGIRDVRMVSDPSRRTDKEGSALLDICAHENNPRHR